MKIFLTGGTGLVGNAVARKLLARGHSVTALVRDPTRAGPLLPGADLVAGDITAEGSLLPAMRGAEWVFHAAGMPEQWQPDDTIFDRVNRGGTANVMRAAREAGVRRVIYTSTMDVFEAAPGGTLVDEKQVAHVVDERGDRQGVDRIE